MVGGASDEEIKEQILRSLKEFYPIKVDEIVLISAVQQKVEDGSIEQISREIRTLRDGGWVEESPIRASLGQKDTYRFKITSSGMEHLQSVENEGGREFSVALARIEFRLTETSDHLKADVDGIKQDMGKTKKELEESIEGMRKTMADLSKELAALKERVDRYMEKAEAESVREEKLILQILSGDERAVYDILLNAGGPMLQKDLVARTKMSNSKISRVLDHLESRGIITKERYGATNRLRITIKPPRA